MKVTIFVGKYCGDSVSNSAAIIVCCGEAQQLGPRSVLQVGWSEGVDLHIQRHREGWSPGGYWGSCHCVHTIHLDAASAVLAGAGVRVGLRRVPADDVRLAVDPLEVVRALGVAVARAVCVGPRGAQQSS